MNAAKNRPLTLLTIVACQAAAGLAALASEPTADDARAALQKRTVPWYDATKDEFRPMKPPAETSTDLSFLRWFFDLFGALSHALGPVLKILMWVMLATVVVILLIVLIRAMQGVELDTPETADKDRLEVDLEKLEALPEPTRGIGGLLAEAERLANRAEFGSAMTFYHSWQLVQLDKQQLVEVQKGKTSRQYSREVRAARPELLDLFSQSIRLFEDAFFGNLPVSGEDFQRVWGQRHRFTFGLRGFRP